MLPPSPAVCQCNSRTPPAVSLMLTPAKAFETGSSRTVTSRDHPPSYTRLLANENGNQALGIGIRRPCRIGILGVQGIVGRTGIRFVAITPIGGGLLNFLCNCAAG